ncbi:hypothetical protein DAI22_04g000200 [Oryza sativa Japonica Group]|nr:hypothetical protein DAI22_04g000200 [Oryza sativa Japonica Group]
MGGSSNTNTNTRSGGGKDKHDETSPSFKEGERVLAYHGPLLYEAKVQKSENKEDEWRYHVHYLGWSKSWDEWVTNDRLLKLTDENIRKQQELEKSQAVDKSVKSGRSAQHKPKDAKTDKEDTKIIVKGKKRKSQPGGTEEKERKSSESLFMSHFPSTLKKQLVDDWEFVTQLGKLVKLPRSPTVDDILKKYLEHRTKKDNKYRGIHHDVLNKSGRWRAAREQQQRSSHPDEFKFSES